MQKIKWSSMICFLLSLFITMDKSTDASSLPFNDISDSFAKTEIIELHRQDVVKGMGDGRFEPHRSVSREEFITMLGRSLNMEALPTEIATFSDVPSYTWSSGWVQAGYALGLIEGKSKNIFAPKASISRQEAAVILVRALHSGEPSPPDQSLSFQDAAAVSQWAKPFVAEAHRQGIMKGYQGAFRPLDPVTREEMAMLLTQLSAKMGSSDKKPPQIFLGWQYLSKGSDFEQRVETSSILNTLSPRWFMLGENGAISDTGNVSFMNWAHDHGYKVWALFGNRTNPDFTHKALSQPDLRKQMIHTLTEAAKKYDLDGLNIDFEGMYVKDRDDFSTFIDELAASLKPLKITLSVDVPPDLDHEWSDPFDYAALGKTADYLVLMGYDEHWATSPVAGSVASLPWLTRGIDRLIADVPASKVIVGLPLYTRDWRIENHQVKSSELFLYQQSKLLSKTPMSIKWDPLTGQNVATYHKNGQTHTLWIEDIRSLSLKYQTALEKGVAGVAFWSIGGETPDIWPGLQNVLKLY